MKLNKTLVKSKQNYYELWYIFFSFKEKIFNPLLLKNFGFLTLSDTKRDEEPTNDLHQADNVRVF